MATQDISRSTFDSRKHYRGVHMQQGRVVVDDDWNEREEIEREDRRRDLVRTIGVHGTSDGGFALSGFSIANKEVDFQIGAGTYYVGGLRAELEAAQDYSEQADWLDQPASERAAPAANRYDLAYVRLWEQPATAVEDSELYEEALGGADTSTRMRTMCQVHLATNVGTDDCHDAWAKTVAAWQKAGLGTLNAEHELERDVTLQVEFGAGGNPGDLCSPYVAGGYLGAENQAIRVQLTQDDRLTWGFDNASRLYRVTLSGGTANKNHMTVTLDSDPKDPTQWPLSGQVVELLPWAAVLPNGEKLAAWSGQMDTVATTYDPVSRQLTLTTGVPITWGTEWQSRSDKGQLAPAYFFLRVWDRAADRSAAELDFTVGSLPLQGTGLSVKVTGKEPTVGDHWVIAARPETPKRVVPWVLEDGVGTRGPRVFLAPLALIQWTPGAATKGKVVHDCRRRFRPLTQIRNCCTVTVGDDRESHGDYESIQDAVQALPPAGGEVCVLPGEYEEILKLKGLTNVTIRGCGGRSVLRVPTGDDTPAIRVEDCTGLTVKSLTIRALEGPAIVVEQDLADQTLGDETHPLTLAELEIDARDVAAVWARANWLRLRDCRISVHKLTQALAQGSKIGREPAVYVSGDDMVVEGNLVLADDSGGATITALGGIQISGGSARVELRRNLIRGGNGNGVTLGSIAWIKQDDMALPEEDWAGFMEASQEFVLGLLIAVDASGCVIVGGGEAPTDDAGDPLVPVSRGILTEIAILDNEVDRMGANGIAAVHFFDFDQVSDVITVDRCRIEDNVIHGCLKLELAPVPATNRSAMAYGGICLAGGEYPLIRGNVIEKNGASHLDPICGIYLLAPQGAVVEGNRVVHNGPRDDTAGGQLAEGQRGGIVVFMATTVPLASAYEGIGLAQDVPLALRVHDNVVVAPEGRALKVGAIGPVSVESNELKTLGAGGPDIIQAASAVLSREDGVGPPLFGLYDLPLGVTVLVLDLGVSSELYGLGLGLNSAKGATPSLAMPGLMQGGTGSLLGQGNVLFSDNQVMLDLGTSDDTQRASSALSSLLVVSFDDVSFHGNQCDCLVTSDWLLANAIVAAWSLRLADNRFKESLSEQIGRVLASGYYASGDDEGDDDGEGDESLGTPTFGFSIFGGATSNVSFFWPRFSAITSGGLNITTDNEGTHCFLAAGPPRTLVRERNVSLLDMFGPKVCRYMQRYAQMWMNLLIQSLVGGGT